MATTKTALAPLDERQRYSIPEAICYLRISRKQIYLDIAAGRLVTFTEGRRRFVPGSELVRRSAAPSTMVAA